jgi:hypothetical protein
VFAAEGAKSVDAAHHIGRRQQGVQFVQAFALAQQGVADKGFHRLGWYTQGAPLLIGSGERAAGQWRR